MFTMVNNIQGSHACAASALKRYVTEFNAEQEKGTSYGAPDNTGTCLRMTGRFGNQSLCNGEPRCDWGGGGLNWLLAEEQAHVAGVVIWPSWYSPTGRNQHGERSGRLVYQDGSLTPMGKAFIASPEGGLEAKPPSPPPPILKTKKQIHYFFHSHSRSLKHSHSLTGKTRRGCELPKYP